MKAYAFIFARGGSKGLPGKNLLEIEGTPLIGLAIQAAQATPEISKVFVSTDDADIAEVARRFGAEVPFLRPSHLAQDESPEWASWRHAVEFLESQGDIFDLFLSVPATAPLRLPQDISAAIDLFQRSDCDLVFSITEAERSPYFAIVSEQSNGFLRPCLSAENVHRRQDAPVVYDVTPVAYVTTPKHIKERFGYYDGRVKGNWVPRERAVDIDTFVDLEMARALYRARRSS